MILTGAKIAPVFFDKNTWSPWPKIRTFSDGDVTPQKYHLFRRVICRTQMACPSAPADSRLSNVVPAEQENGA